MSDGESEKNKDIVRSIVTNETKSEKIMTEQKRNDNDTEDSKISVASIFKKMDKTETSKSEKEKDKKSMNGGMKKENKNESMDMTTIKKNKEKSKHASFKKASVSSSDISE